MPNYFKPLEAAVENMNAVLQAQQAEMDMQGEIAAVKQKMAFPPMLLLEVLHPEGPHTLKLYLTEPEYMIWKPVFDKINNMKPTPKPELDWHK